MKLQQGVMHPIAQVRVHALTLALAAVPCGHALAEQPPRAKLCMVAMADKDLLSVNCPKGRLVELLAGIRDRTGVAFYVPPNLLTTPASVVLDNVSLQSALDAALAEYDYTLDGAAVLANGRAAGTRVTIFSMRELSSDIPHAPSSDASTTAQRRYEPEPSVQSDEPVPADLNVNELGNPSDEAAQTEDVPPSVPGASAEQQARVREAFLANLPTPDAALPMAASPAELPPSPSVTNQTGPGDGRRSLPLPEFTVGMETSAPPGIPR